VPSPPPPVAPGAISAGLIKWARAVARGVRADYRFRRGSQEEWDIESAAFEELTRAAGRWVPERAGLPAGTPPAADPGAFRGFAARAVRAACRREARRLRSCGMVSERGHRHGGSAGDVRSLAGLRAPGGDPWEPADHRGADPDPPPDPRVEAAGRWGRWLGVRGRWAAAPVRTRVMVYLWLAEGWPLRQAAAAFGVTEETARRAVRRRLPPG
jgi:DNA-directed RNA polymerase specialized sigma24 family protein